LQAGYDAATSHLDPPLAIVDLAAFDRNAEQLRERASGLPIRVVSKSVRCRYLLQRVLGTDGYAGVMAYSLHEALWLCRAAVSTDLLVGYPTVDRARLRELAADPTGRRNITVMIDSAEHLDLIDSAAGADHEEIRVCLELDASWRPLHGSPLVHLGTRRSPVFAPAAARRLAEQVLRRPGFRLVGVMAYEGQIAGMGDNPPGHPVQARMLRWMQGRSAAELAQRRAAAVREVSALAELEFVNGGGTGSMETTSAESAVTEVAGGSGLIGPTLFDSYSRFRPQPAALFALPVVRRPGKRFATLFSGGYLASGPALPSRLPSPYLPAGLRLVEREGAGEVQTPVTGPAAAALRLGDRVWLRHAKAGELAERFEQYHLVRDGKLVGVVPTYRGDGQSFG
jgi:D-serine deaminase-like pyridoxal phosphate-dependent protein